MTTGTLGRRARHPAVVAATGALVIAASAILVRLSGASPTAATLFRCAFALPVLWALVVVDARARPRATMTPKMRWLVRLAGVALASDLVLWTHAIYEVGAGLATILANLQVLFVAVLAWWLLGERLKRSLVVAFPIMAIGIVCVSGILGANAYGDAPVLGTAHGIAASVLYAGFLLILRHAMSATPLADGRSVGPIRPMYEATLGATVAATLFAVVLPDFHIGPWWPALGWLALVAVSSQALGWLLISSALPRLPAAAGSMLLLIQPAGAMVLAALVLGEDPSKLQILGVVLILAGVVVTTTGTSVTRAPPPA